MPAPPRGSGLRQDLLRTELTLKKPMNWGEHRVESLQEIESLFNVETI